MPNGQAFSAVLWCSTCPYNTAGLPFLEAFQTRSIDLRDSRLVGMAKTSPGGLAAAPRVPIA